MKRFALLPLLFALPAAGQPQSQPAGSQPVAASQPVEQGAASQPVAAPPVKGEEKTLTGKLTWHEIISGRKSVEAYEGVEFRINGEPVEPSEHVSRDALLALKDKQVEVVCVMRKGVVPGPMESYPINHDGSPAPRPDQCQIHKIALK